MLGPMSLPWCGLGGDTSSKAAAAAAVPSTASSEGLGTAHAAGSAGAGVAGVTVLMPASSPVVVALALHWQASEGGPHQTGLSTCLAVKALACQLQTFQQAVRLLRLLGDVTSEKQCEMLCSQLHSQQPACPLSHASTSPAARIRREPPGVPPSLLFSI